MTQAHRAVACLPLCVLVAALLGSMPAGAQQTDLLCACPDIDWDIKPQASEVTQAIHAYNVDQVAEADLGKVRALNLLRGKAAQLSVQGLVWGLTEDTTQSCSAAALVP